MSDSYETQFPFVDLTLLEMERPVGHLLKEEIAERIEGVCIGKISDNQLSDLLLACEHHYNVLNRERCISS